MNVQAVGTSILENIPYRRTYLYLGEVINFMRSVDNAGIMDDPLFLTSFSSYFLLNAPQFNFDAHGHSSVQTFYANHYLRETLKLDALPEPENVLAYINSDKFDSTLIKLCSIFCKVKSENSITFVESKPQTKNSLAPHPPMALNNLIKGVISEVENSSPSAYISSSDQPSEAIYTELKESGFAVKNDFLSSSALSDIAYITDEIAKYEKKTGSAYFYGTAGKNQRIYNLIAKHPIYADLISSPYITTLLDRVFDRPTLHEKFGLNSLTAHIVPPGAKAIPLHIDSVCPEPIPPWMIRFIIILPLADFTKHNGATAFVPGSHKFLRRPGPNDIINHASKEVVTECKAGSLVLFDGATWHRSSDNQTKNHRPGLMLSFAASYFMELCGEEEHLTVIPNQIIESFTPKVQQMIGYNRAIKKGAMDISSENRTLSYKSSK